MVSCICVHRGSPFLLITLIKTSFNVIILEGIHINSNTITTLSQFIRKVGSCFVLKLQASPKTAKTKNGVLFRTGG